MSECARIKPVSDALSTLTNPAEIMAYEAVPARRHAGRSPHAGRCAEEEGRTRARPAPRGRRRDPQRSARLA